MSVPNAVDTLLRGPGDKLLSGIRLAQYQGNILEDHRLSKLSKPLTLPLFYPHPWIQLSITTQRSEDGILSLARLAGHSPPGPRSDPILRQQQVIYGVQRMGGAVFILEQTVK